MKKYRLILVILLPLLLLFCGAATASEMKKDIVLMIDNSGSMRKNDPHFLTKKAVTQFVENLSDDTRVAVLIFDHRINMAVPLTLATEEAKKDILASFDKINFRGQLTNIPNAMERCIYELKSKGLEDAQKLIIFITDGIVDTGDKTRDIDKTRWLRENLSENAAALGIKIFGIAFTDQADFELIQSLAQKTKGDYFRAFTPEDIPDVFSKMNTLISRMEPEPEPEPAVPVIPKPEPVIMTPPVTSAAPPETTVAAPPVKEIQPRYAPPQTRVPAPSRSSNLKIILAGVLSIAIVAAIFVLFLLKSKKKAGGAKPFPQSVYGRAGTKESVPKASLRDVDLITGQDAFEITGKVTSIGRKAIKKGAFCNDIVVNKSSISRQHAAIEYKDRFFWIIDQRSANGTWVNDERVTNEMRLKHGDRIRFDQFEFEFVIHEIVQMDSDISDDTVFRDLEDVTIIQEVAVKAQDSGIQEPAPKEPEKAPVKMPVKMPIKMEETPAFEEEPAALPLEVAEIFAPEKLAEQAIEVEEEPIPEDVEEVSTELEEAAVDEDIEKVTVDLEESPIAEDMEEVPTELEGVDTAEDTEEIHSEVEEAPVAEDIAEVSAKLEEAAFVEGIRRMLDGVEEPPVTGDIQEMTTELEEAPIVEDIEEMPTETEEAPVGEDIEEMPTEPEAVPVVEDIEKMLTDFKEAPVAEDIEEMLTELEEAPVDEELGPPPPGLEESIISEEIDTLQNDEYDSTVADFKIPDSEDSDSTAPDYKAPVSEDSDSTILDFEIPDSADSDSTIANFELPDSEDSDDTDEGKKE